MQRDATSSTPEELLLLLDRNQLAYEIVEHEPVFTIAEALVATPAIGGAKTKNVFLRDAKGARHFLVVAPHDVRLDLAALAGVLGTSKLGMGSPERLLRCLGVKPGAVSILALVNDRAQAVELLVDERVWDAGKVQAHPLRNTATLALDVAALAAFLRLTGHQPRIVRV